MAAPLSAGAAPSAGSTPFPTASPVTVRPRRHRPRAQLLPRPSARDRCWRQRHGNEGGAPCSTPMAAWSTQSASSPSARAPPRAPRCRSTLITRRPKTRCTRPPCPAPRRSPMRSPSSLARPAAAWPWCASSARAASATPSDIAAARRARPPRPRSTTATRFEAAGGACTMQQQQVFYTDRPAHGGRGRCQGRPAHHRRRQPAWQTPKTASSSVGHHAMSRAKVVAVQPIRSTWRCSRPAGPLQLVTAARFATAGPSHRDRGRRCWSRLAAPERHQHPDHDPRGDFRRGRRLWRRARAPMAADLRARQLRQFLGRGGGQRQRRDPRHERAAQSQRELADQFRGGDGDRRHRESTKALVELRNGMSPTDSAADHETQGRANRPDTDGPVHKCRRCSPGPGAAAAGLQAGDILLKVGNVLLPRT